MITVGTLKKEVARAVNIVEVKNPKPLKERADRLAEFLKVPFTVEEGGVVAPAVKVGNTVKVLPTFASALEDVEKADLLLIALITYDPYHPYEGFRVKLRGAPLLSDEDRELARETIRELILEGELPVPGKVSPLRQGLLSPETVLHFLEVREIPLTLPMDIRSVSLTEVSDKRGGEEILRKVAPYLPWGVSVEVRKEYGEPERLSKATIGALWGTFPLIDRKELPRTEAFILLPEEGGEMNIYSLKGEALELVVNSVHSYENFRLLKNLYPDIEFAPVCDRGTVKAILDGGVIKEADGKRFVVPSVEREIEAYRKLLFSRERETDNSSEISL